MNLLTKLIILIALIISSSLTSIGQSWKSIKLTNHQVGVNLFQFRDLAHYDFYNTFSGNIVPRIGISYKAQVKTLVSLRAFTSYSSKFSHHTDGGHVYDAAWDYIDKERYVDLSLGLEQRMSKGRISTYLFGDIYQQFGNRSRKGSSYGFAGPVIFDDSYNYYQIGLATGVGMKINLTKQLNINIESHIRAVHESGSYGAYDYRHGKYQVNYNPISRFSLNYRFSQKKT